MDNLRSIEQSSSVVLDDETTVPLAARVSETAFAVDGMFCGGCASTVERALKRLAGVQSVSVSFLGNSAHVTHDPIKVSPDTLAKRLASLGYEARSLDNSQSDHAQSKFQRAHQIRLAIAIGFGLWVMMASMAHYLTELPTERFEWQVALAAGIFSLPVLLYSGMPFFKLGWRGLIARAPGMETLILVATVAAVSGSMIELWQGRSHVWFEVPVMLIIFQLIARLTDFGARRRAADAIRSMLDLSPETARRVDADGLNTVAANTLRVNEVIESRAGEH
nr:cation transporter [Granulosicoccus sp.]